jgi:hypothetical protein
MTKEQAREYATRIRLGEQVYWGLEAEHEPYYYGFMHPPTCIAVWEPGVLGAASWQNPSRYPDGALILRGDAGAQITFYPERVLEFLDGIANGQT